MSTQISDSTTSTNATKKTLGKTITNEFYEISEEEKRGELEESENEVTYKSEQGLLKISKTRKTRKNGRINFPVELVRNISRTFQKLFGICLFQLFFISFLFLCFAAFFSRYNPLKTLNDERLSCKALGSTLLKICDLRWTLGSS